MSTSISPAAVSLTTQFLTVAVLTLQRQLQHNRALQRTTVNSEYDFIVVGGGTAGCLVAGRLSAPVEQQGGQQTPPTPPPTVLLLEAGGPMDVVHEIVANTIYQAAMGGAWLYQSVPQAHSCMKTSNFKLFFNFKIVLTFFFFLLKKLLDFLIGKFRCNMGKFSAAQ